MNGAAALDLDSYEQLWTRQLHMDLQPVAAVDANYDSAKREILEYTTPPPPAHMTNIPNTSFNVNQHHSCNADMEFG